MMQRTGSRKALALLFAGLVSLAPTSLAQEAPGARPDEALREWRRNHGESWRMRHRDADEGRLLYGGRGRGDRRVRSDADYAEEALRFAREARTLLEMDADSLDARRVRLLALGSVGGVDKVAVRLEQTVDGVPVRGGSVNALLSGDGDLLSLQSTAVDTTDVDVRPTVTPEQATRVAIEDFTALVGIAPNGISDAELVIVRRKIGKRMGGRLAWEMELRFDPDAGLPDVYLYRIAAQGRPRVLGRTPRVHRFELGGQARALATPGLAPDSASNPPIEHPLVHATVSGPGGTRLTDETGGFHFEGETTGSVSVAFSGPFVHVVDALTGSTASVSATLSGPGNALLLNPLGTADQTAQANAFIAHNAVRDFIRRVNPADDTADFQVRANVNLNDECNAFYDGSSTNFFLSGGGCANTAYSTVVAHEMGHYLNDLYGNGNGPDGFGEGAADIWAMYLYDTPVVGLDFAGSDVIRTGLNSRSYCGDGNAGCYGAVHTDGEVLMGAMWKLRENLNATHGNGAGDAIADSLFLAWMSSFDQGTIDSVIETQLLILDDDDGIIENGTPNYRDIDDAFRSQGFPGYDLPDVLFSDVTVLADTQDELGPYNVSATVRPRTAPDMLSASLTVDVDSVITSVPMTRVTGTDTWLGSIPGQPSPSLVEYRVAGVTSLGQIHSSDPIRFRVGRLVTLFEDDFESGTNGWTHQLSQGQDDWQHGAPQGAAGSSFDIAWSDPSVAASGTSVWGNDLAIGNFNGAYQPDVVNFLLSPSINLAGANGAELRFQRWLTVEEGIFDTAQVLVNGTVVWENPPNEHIVDTEWTEMVIDISAVADGVADTRIQFRLESDGALELGGWNIDDLQVLSLDPAPSTCLPTPTGIGLGGLGGTPTLDSAGQQVQVGNAAFELRVRNAPPGALTVVVFGHDPLNLPLFGGTLLVDPATSFATTTDAFGQASAQLAVPDLPNLAGEDFFAQAFVVDPTAPQGVAMTGALELVVCP